jgi:hypothetical protein
MITDYQVPLSVKVGYLACLGSGYIAFPVTKVFLAVFNKLIEKIISAKKYEIN